MSFNLKRQPKKRSFLDQRYISTDCSNGLSHSKKKHTNTFNPVWIHIWLDTETKTYCTHFMATALRQLALHLKSFRPESKGLPTRQDLCSDGKSITRHFQAHLCFWNIGWQIVAHSTFYTWLFGEVLSICCPLSPSNSTVNKTLMVWWFDKKGAARHFFSLPCQSCGGKTTNQFNTFSQVPQRKKQQQQNPTSIHTVHISDDA